MSDFENISKSSWTGQLGNGEAPAAPVEGGVHGEVSARCVPCKGTGHTEHGFMDCELCGGTGLKQTKISWEYVGEELAVFWDSPYGHGKEKIASFWWPAHPPEATEDVEHIFEQIVERLALNARAADAGQPQAETVGQEPRAPGASKTPLEAQQRQLSRNWLQEHFPVGNPGFWNWQTVDSLAGLLASRRSASREQPDLNEQQVEDIHKIIERHSTDDADLPDGRREMVEKIYEWLGREFKQLESRLDPEGKTELDGKLWRIANDLANFPELDLDRPSCAECGIRMVKDEQTFKCPNCGTRSGHS